MLSGFQLYIFGLLLTFGSAIWLRIHKRDEDKYGRDPTHWWDFKSMVSTQMLIVWGLSAMALGALLTIKHR
jgi:hypothetical protein